MQQNKLNKVIKIAITVVLVVFAVLLLLHYLHTGTLVVTATKDATIQVTNPSGKVVAQGTGNLTTHLNQGEYTLLVGGKSLATNKPVVIHGRKTLTVYIAAIQAKIIEPVTPGEASSIVANSTSLTYVDSNGALNHIDQANRRILLNGTKAAVLDIAWADSSFGAMLGSDGTVYTIDHGSLQPTSLTISNINDQYAAIAVTPDHHIYVSQNNYLYFGDASGFSKIYTATNPIVSLTASGSVVAAITNKTITANGQPTIQAKLLSIDSTGRQVGAINLPTNDSQSTVMSLAWSPSGKLLAIANGSSLGALYNVNLQKLVDLPEQNITSAAWLGNDTLYFSTSKDSLLWRYSYQSGSAAAVANATPGSSIRDVAVGDAHNDIYFSVTDTSSNQTLLERISLEGTQKSSTTYQLGFFLPATLTNCSVSFVNFTRPVLYADYTTSQAACQAELTKTLQQDNLDVRQLPVRYSLHEID